ncbi:hypothetical protein G3N58_15160 [Paraburkholderia sp. Ac-20342]|uniref:hypothetical protein n=1 Tax=Paraburkholderia sp. Ac-20342 TaxID=2703889 RepID=UPI00197CD9DA|nr:hypothetical protein [Paraburkholderia sp. Ac-20342]MBN3848159.1 hypothetical protein [Paraburkholderia sp. Ac-20342]
MKIERLDIGGWKPIGLTYETADDECRSRCNAIVLYAFRRRIEWRLPEFLKPYSRWIDTSVYSWSTNPARGYFDIHSREWGFRVSEGFLQVFFGAQTNDSTTTKSWCTHLPWTQWRFVRESYFGLQGELLRTFGDREARGFENITNKLAYEKTVPKRVFRFLDYDGEEIEAATHIEEFEFHFGQGWFKWLSLFRRARVRRSLDIAFSKEVGPEKGSWKGGTLGHGIELRPGELHADGFARYADEHRFTLID